MAFCPHCGAAVQGGAFCASCGRALASASRPGEPALVKPYVPGPAPAPSGQRPVGVTLASVGFFLLAMGMALGGLFLMVLGPLIAATDTPPWFFPFNVFTAWFGALAIAVALMLFVLTGLLAAVGYGLLKGSSWAWVAALVVAGLGVLSNVADLAQADFGGVLGLLVWGGLIYYFLRPEVKAWFGR